MDSQGSLGDPEVSWGIPGGAGQDFGSPNEELNGLPKESSEIL